MGMRKIVLYIGLLAIIIGGAPYFTGYLVETKFQDVVHVLSDIDSANIEIVKYERGWRKSFAQTKVTFAGEYPQALVDITPGLNSDQKISLKQTGFTVLLDHDIRHGPFVQMKDGDWKDWRFALAAFHSQILLTDKTKELLEKLLGQSKLVDINGEISIEGAVSVKFEGVPLKLNEGNTDALVWKGMHGNWNLSRDMKHFQTEIVFPGVSVQMGTKTFGVEDVLGHYDLHKSAEGLWLGKISGNVNKLALLDSQSPDDNISLIATTIGSVSNSESGMIDGSASIIVEQIKISNKDIGPFNLVMSIKNIDANFLKALIDFSKKVQATNAQPNPLMTQELMTKLSDLLKHRPVFSIDNISLKTSDGEVKGDFNIAVGGEQARDVNNINQLIQSIVAKANAVIPKATLVELLTDQNIQTAETANAAATQNNQTPLTADEIKQKSAEKTQETIAGMLKDGYMIEKDNMYTTEWEFIEGQLKVNGKPMALPQQAPGVVPPTGHPAPASPAPGTTSSVQ